jgi:uncharacterized protein YecE (DUF72 family)
MIVIATAGWSIPRIVTAQFSGRGTHLQRYARALRGVEINSSFYREHSRETYAHWASLTPRTFKFAVKFPGLITHEHRLRRARRPLQEYLENVAGLGRRLGPLVVQLPPSLDFESRVARTFFGLLRECHDGPVVCEPRHPTWFTGAADELLRNHRIGRVAADPAVVPAAAQPGGWPGIVYRRLHGSPRKYWSIYDAHGLSHWAQELNALPRSTPAWCVFDNTAGAGAAGNALQMRKMLRDARR